ncbi:Carcinoembryonic antigen-related cell adhesion molecule 1 [Camelus dromedarius]|uniref:Carcinoembryonic antigen-related cell adhesion molecule 1 n=1 Tax=Camelus dromedarius TaxID=9838 RepID=A0A5N4DU99_CAMDR|nr:Carcinoembryonic antigen-related cell adhesion molecule 1 [Camelus dromedarius]
MKRALSTVKQRHLHSLFSFLSMTDDSTQGSSSGLSDGAIAGIVIGAVAGVALIAALVYFLYIRNTGRASDQHDLTQHKSSDSNHSQGHSDNSPSKKQECPKENTTTHAVGIVYNLESSTGADPP